MKQIISNVDLETIKLILGKSGFNPTRYKDTFLKRRIEAAFRRSTAKSHDEYYLLLKQDPNERKKLEQYFSINVTRFFRNLDTFEQLESLYLPQLLTKKKESGKQFVIKAWSVGCATGAEPYTLAIVLSRILGVNSTPTSVNIVGTDYNPEMIEIAEKGIYPTANMEEVHPSILNRYFTKKASGLYQINPKIQKLVRFRTHDLLKDPPLKQQDLVVCRNVLIYFSRSSQNHLYDELVRSLNPHGLLILGRTEILPHQFRPKFKILDKKHRIYKKIPPED